MNIKSAKTETTANGLGKPYPNVKRPSKETLKKYGLSLDEWEKMLIMQAGVCAVCHKVSTTGRLVTDHEHAKNWKKMPPEQRKLYVRGLLCWVCNHYTLGRGATIAKFIAAAAYLENHDERKRLNNVH